MQKGSVKRFGCVSKPMRSLLAAPFTLSPGMHACVDCDMHRDVSEYYRPISDWNDCGTDLMYPEAVIIYRSKRLVVYGTQYEWLYAIAYNSVRTTLHAQPLGCNTSRTPYEHPLHWVHTEGFKQFIRPRPVSSGNNGFNA